MFTVGIETQMHYATCTCFLFSIVNLLFSYLATQPQVWNETQVSVSTMYIRGESW